MARICASQFNRNHTFKGYFDDNYNHPSVLGKIEGIDSYLKDHSVDEVYCCLPYLRYGLIKKIIATGEDRLVKVKLITDFRGFAFGDFCGLVVVWFGNKNGEG